MKPFYSILSAMVAVVLFAPLAVADPGTTWDKKINKPGRFKVVSQFNGKAVLDQETGRVWEQSPDTGLRTWFGHCYDKDVGGRKGWRLPTIEELTSLVDPNNPGGDPDLPPDHPFDNDNVQSSNYWSATTRAGNTGFAWVVSLFSGGVNVDGKSNGVFVWCVRGGQGIDGL